MKTKDIVDSITNSRLYKRAYKRFISAKVGKCDRCPWHDVENFRKRPRTDKYKNKDRRTIRNI